MLFDRLVEETLFAALFNIDVIVLLAFLIVSVILSYRSITTLPSLHLKSRYWSCCN